MDATTVDVIREKVVTMSGHFDLEAWFAERETNREFKVLSGNDDVRTHKWGGVLLRLTERENLHPESELIKLPADAESHQAWYTAQVGPKVIVDDGLFGYVLWNKPATMGSSQARAFVISEATTADQRLMTIPPFLMTAGRPSWIMSAESPLLYEDERPTAWQGIVGAVMRAIDDRL